MWLQGQILKRLAKLKRRLLSVIMSNNTYHRYSQLLYPNPWWCEGQINKQSKWGLVRCSSERVTAFPLTLWRNLWTCNLSRLAEDQGGFRPRFSFIVTVVYLCLRVQNFWSSVPERRLKKNSHRTTMPSLGRAAWVSAVDAWPSVTLLTECCGHELA